MRYQLTGLVTSSAGAAVLSAATNAQITSRADTPSSGMTTYWVPLFTKSESTTTVLAAVVLFDVALVDGNSSAIRHDVVAVSDTADGSTEYEVVLELPPFAQTLVYDPSLGLGVLLGVDHGSGGGGSDNLGLIIGVAVAVPVAIVVVLVAVVVGSALAWSRRGKRVRSGTVINFGAEEDDSRLDL